MVEALAFLWALVQTLNADRQHPAGSIGPILDVVSGGEPDSI
jgi:hypothetical protein